MEEDVKSILKGNNYFLHSFSYRVQNADFWPRVNEIPAVATSQHLAGNKVNYHEPHVSIRVTENFWGWEMGMVNP